MKLVTFTYRGRTRVGEIIGDQVAPLAWADPMRSLLRRGVVGNRTYERFSLAEVKIEPPLIPSKIVAIGLNYADHAKETGKEPPAEPLIFAKYSSAIVGTQEAITWRKSITDAVDWEAELAVVIGKRGKDIPEENAYDYVFGYTCANDVSARDLQHGKDSQWTRGKSLDTFCPLGPVLVTRDEIEDPHTLTVETKVNDEVMQSGNTGDMIFKIPYLIAYVSRMFTLEPGDIILTGTPAGVGRGRTPPIYLKGGDVVTVSIQGIGELVNHCQEIDDVSEPASDETPEETA